MDNTAPASIPTITVQELKARLDRGEQLQLIDVREVHEHQICNLPQARLIPLGELPGKLHELDSSQEYVIHCKIGVRSAQAVDLMRKSGFSKVFNVAGGITAWAREIEPSMPTY